jgi:hypothetical protein
MTRITIQIDGLIVHGEAPGDPEAFARALEHELAARFRSSKTSEGFRPAEARADAAHTFADTLAPVLASHLNALSAPHVARRGGR